MSKVLIDRALLERIQERLDPHRDAVLWGAVCDTFHTAPSSTPAMPVKAYYYEAPNEYGGLNKSVGLEVRKQFNDAPLVLESDALTQIACLEGEIAKRDEELAACRVAVENCEVFRARIVELEHRCGVYGLELHNATERLQQAERQIKAIKAGAGEPVAYRDTTSGTLFPSLKSVERYGEIGREIKPLYYAQPPARIVMPEQDGSDAQKSFWVGFEFAVCGLHNNDIRAAWNDFKSSERFKRLAAAPAAPAADAGLVEALSYQSLFDAIAAATSVYANGAINISVQAFRDALAAHSAKGVV